MSACRSAHDACMCAWTHTYMFKRSIRCVRSLHLTNANKMLHQCPAITAIMMRATAIVVAELAGPSFRGGDEDEVALVLPGVILPGLTWVFPLPGIPGGSRD